MRCVFSGIVEQVNALFVLLSAMKLKSMVQPSEAKCTICKIDTEMCSITNMCCANIQHDFPKIPNNQSYLCSSSKVLLSL